MRIFLGSILLALVPGLVGVASAQDVAPELFHPLEPHGVAGPSMEFLRLPDRALVAREAFRRAQGVLDGWWTTRDPARRRDGTAWGRSSDAPRMS